MPEKILTRHPQGKQGVNIDKQKYNVIAETIRGILQERGEATFDELASAAGKRLSDSFDGSIPWYVVTVKLDLEARGVLERVPKTSPQKLRLKSN